MKLRDIYTPEPLPASRELSWTKSDPDLMRTDIADEYGHSVSDLTRAEQGHISKRSWDPAKDRHLINLMADHGLIDGDMVYRGLAFDSPEEAEQYVRRTFKGGYFSTRQNDHDSLESFTVDPDVARRFATVHSAQVMPPDKPRNAHGVIIAIKRRRLRGHRMDYGESEAVLPRGQVYKVTDITKDTDGQGFVTILVELG